MHERCERHPERKKERKKESEALSETDGLCSSEHGLWGIGFGGSPIGYAGFMSCFKVQGNFLLYSVHPIILSATHMFIIH